MTQRLTPYLLYDDGEAALAWLERAFGFRAVDRQVGRAGGLHAELEIDADGTRLYLGQPPGGSEPPRGSLLYVLVDDVDAHHDRAKAAGAEIVEELVDMPHGHRRYGCRDPQGHEWTFATPITQ
jgi:uncharacterized glyoxalase superfamily protein PhnB